MRYSIFDFNQQKLVKETNLELSDILLLKYIIDAVASPAMQHKLDELTNRYYVWLKHDKILEDLPILYIKKDRLKHKLGKLCKDGFLESLQVSNENGRGSRTYYSVTERTIELLYEPRVTDNTRKDDHVLQTTPENEGPGVIHNTSDSKLKKTNKELNIDNNKNFNFGNSRTKKPNLYQQCTSMIIEFTEDGVLRKKLNEYLALRLEMRDKQLYPNSWKGILNKLKEFMDKGEDPIEVLDQSIQRGYPQIYPVSKKTYKKTSGYVDDIPEGINGTHEHYEGDHSLSGLYF